MQGVLIPCFIRHTIYQKDTTVADQCIWKWSNSQINALILFQRPSGRWNNEHFIFYELQEMICFLCDVGYFSSLIEFHISLLRPDVMFIGIDECIIQIGMKGDHFFETMAFLTISTGIMSTANSMETNNAFAFNVVVLNT